ncbi:uncharacterized protein [Blastocystis hominis]|uniref:GOLD domain-containing protein n=1 Tax=Blastocystis hominis TaxID=12968 RepID=D8M9V8_BLAHO|nr:uncharacterized protein [Blastocystis hominis]CBK24847.2 unnamed protein product [Blastocystis hominis]|eukprot:XP_012898895.1 uncharacterized protein [Blastocystis hominis]
MQKSFLLSVSVIIEIPAGEKRCLYDEMGIGHKPHMFITSIGRDEVISDHELGIDPDHPPTFRDTLLEIPYFSEYAFCLDNDKTRYSKAAKIVDIRFDEGENEDGLDTIDDDLLKGEDIIHIGDSMKEIQSMTTDIKGKQAAYRLQEEERRAIVMKTHDRVSLVNLIEIVTFFLFSVVQIFVIRRWFNNKKALLG